MALKKRSVGAASDERKRLVALLARIINRSIDQDLQAGGKQAPKRLLLKKN